jgi:disulfide bond formation protein DsbB
MPIPLARALNVLALYALSAVLLIAFYDQFVGGSLPCPLCILQRAGFAVVGAGLVLNVLSGPSPRGYSLMILGTLAGGAIALRQIALHVVPGTGGYGPPLLGLHLYSWAFVEFAAVLLGCGVMLALYREPGPAVRRGGAATVAVALFFAIVLGNGVSTLAECGGGLCPDNPTAYKGFGQLRKWLDISSADENTTPPGQP